MAASNSYVPNLCVDALEARATSRKAFYSDLVRSFASIAQPAADLLVPAVYIFLVYSLFSVTSPLRQRAIGSIVVGIVAALSHAQRRQSSICNLISVRNTETILRSAVLSQLSFLCVNLLIGRHLPAWIYALSTVAIAILMLLTRGVIAQFLRWVHQAGYGSDPVVIYGHSETTKEIANAMLRSPSCGFHPVVMINDDSLPGADSIFRSRHELYRSVPVNTGPLTSTKLISFQCKLLILAAPRLSRKQIATASDIARRCGADVAILPLAMDSEVPLEQIEIDGLHLAMRMRTASLWHANLLKRAMDASIALILILLGLPVLLLIALCIKLDSRGPVLFEQKRVGRNGELFTIFKFRSMHMSSSKYEASPTKATDPRITRVGRLLRRTGLDETAQLLNVLLGQMSLVGPRPEMPFLVERHIQQHAPRLQAIPGITGLWQLSTDRAFPIHQNTQYDLFYIRNRTLWMDAAILFHTLLFAMRGGV